MFPKGMTSARQNPYLYWEQFCRAAEYIAVKLSLSLILLGFVLLIRAAASLNRAVYSTWRVPCACHPSGPSLPQNDKKLFVEVNQGLEIKSEELRSSCNTRRAQGVREGSRTHWEVS